MNDFTFNTWSIIRLSARTGYPKGRYCANLGHKQDDESGIIYMRARYYEPGSGRFVNSDPNQEGTNFYIYGNDNPIGYRDASGCGSILELLQLLAEMLKDAKSATEALLMIGDIESAEDVAYQEWMSKGAQYQAQFDAVKATATDGVSIDAQERLRIMNFLEDSAIDCRAGANAERAFFKEQIEVERMMYEIERDAELE